MNDIYSGISKLLIMDSFVKLVIAITTAGQPILIKFMIEEAVVLHSKEFNAKYDPEGYIIPSPTFNRAVKTKKRSI